jgi:hypothetical protein
VRGSEDTPLASINLMIRSNNINANAAPTRGI